MLEKLKEQVYNANMELVRRGLVLYTWGNVSGIDRSSGIVVIKPSGVSYGQLKPSDMVAVRLDGTIAEGELNPSSDTPTHLELYRRFEKIGGVVHTHSTNATSWAQAQRGIPFYGTTHADYFYGEIPCTRPLTQSEVEGEYELNTGKVICERLGGSDPLSVPGVLVASHGPFTWGKDADNAVYNAVVLEEIAVMALNTERINAQIEPAPQYMLDKHYLRKHGANAYYGQKPKK